MNNTPLLPPFTGTPEVNRVHHCDTLTLLRAMPDCSVQTCITSPPYFGLRDYGTDGQIGLEETPHAYIARLVDVFRQVKRVLRDDGTLWLNIGDSYAAGSAGMDPYRKTSSGKLFPQQGRTTGDRPEKNLLGIPWRLAFALQDDGWILRSDIIWHKPNPMPESVTDRPTKSHEYVFLLAKSPRYYYDAAAIAEPTRPESKARASRAVSTHHKNLHIPGQTQHSFHKARANGQGYNVPDIRNKRSVWSVNTVGFSEAHFAVFPPKLITPMVLAGSAPGDLVLDPFMGSGTTALVARQNGRNYIGCDLNIEYVELARRRLAQPYTPMLPGILEAAS